ncbi:hypothetical protein JCM5350_001672, partial [Sporobolomyces pararoseus]
TEPAQYPSLWIKRLYIHHRPKTLLLSAVPSSPPSSPNLRSRQPTTRYFAPVKHSTWSGSNSYFGVVNSGEQAHAIIEASKLGLLPRVTRRLTDEERLRFVRAGAVFVWEEEEAGIRRWTDHIKWSPSRVSGAFLTYTEVPSKGPETLIKQSFSSVDPTGTKMHLIAYSNKTALSDGSLPSAAHDPLIQGMLARRSNAGRDPRQQPDSLLSTPTPVSTSNSPTSCSSGSSVPNPAKRRQYRGSHPALPPIFPVLPSPSASSASFPPPVPPSHTSTLPPMLLDPRQRPQSTSQDGDTRPRSANSVFDDRPRTSSSEPRPNSSYDSLPRSAFPTSSFPFPLPSLAPNPPLSSSSSSSSSRNFPPFYQNLGQHPIDPFSQPRPPPPSSNHSFDIQRNSPFLFPPAIASSASDLPLAHRIPPNSAPSFDSRNRELPPFAGLPPILPGSRHDSPPQTFSGGQEEGGPAWRGMEDERQLSLLGRRL